MTARAFFIGLAMGSYDHDYRAVHSLLTVLRGRRVSKRIWLVTIDREVDRILSLLKSSLAKTDGLLIVECPTGVKLDEGETAQMFNGAELTPLSTDALPPSVARAEAATSAKAMPVETAVPGSLNETLTRLGLPPVRPPELLAAARAPADAIGRDRLSSGTLPRSSPTPRPRGSRTPRHT